MKKIDKKTIIYIILVVVLFIAVILFSVFSRNNNNLYVDETPAPSGIASAEENDFNFETANPIYEKQLFINNKVLTAADNNGTLSVGINNSVEECNGIGLILNPSYSQAKADKKYGYIINAKYSTRIITSESEYKTIADQSLADKMNLYVDWTYDKLKSAQYIDAQNYGVIWTVDVDEPDFTKEGVKIIVVDLENHNYISSFTAEIVKNDSNKFEISRLYNNDINVIPEERAEELWNLDIGDNNDGIDEWNAEIDKQIKELEAETANNSTNSEVVSNEEMLNHLKSRYKQKMPEFDYAITLGMREQLINDAIEVIKSEEYITTSENVDKSTAIVELTEGTYHSKYLTNDLELGYTGNVTYPVWAVTLNSSNPELGHMTFYYSKDGYTLLGCDFFWLEDEETLNRYMK